MNALKIAEEIFANGRIEDPENWDEMEVELDFELDTLGIEDPEEREIIMDTVRIKWYPEA